MAKQKLHLLPIGTVYESRNGDRAVVIGHAHHIVRVMRLRDKRYFDIPETDFSFYNEKGEFKIIQKGREGAETE